MKGGDDSLESEIFYLYFRVKGGLVNLSKQSIILGLGNAQHGELLRSSASCRQAFILKFTPTHSHAQMISKTLDREVGVAHSLGPSGCSPWQMHGGIHHCRAVVLPLG